DAAGIEADRPRQLVFRDPLQRAMHQLEVDRIEAGGMNVDHDFARPSPRIGNLRKPDIVGDGTVAGEKVSAHRSIPAEIRKVQTIENERERAKTAPFWSRLCLPCPRP